jgi:hypothetical protein
MTDSIRSSRNFLHTPFTLFRRKESSLCPPTATDHYPKTKLLRPTRRNPTILQQTLFISSPTTTIILDTTCFTSGGPLLAGVQKAQTWYFDSDFLFSCGAPKRLLVRRASSVLLFFGCLFYGTTTGREAGGNGMEINYWQGKAGELCVRGSVVCFSTDFFSLFIVDLYVVILNPS